MEFKIGNRVVSETTAPLVIAEIGINHEGDVSKAVQMIDDAIAAGCECVKFQCHIVEDEMAPCAKDVIPGNADVSIYEIMERCALTEEEEIYLKKYCEDKCVIYLSTPFSRKAADRLERMGVEAYKIGSGECNNYPLIRHIAGFGRPVILSTGMNDIESVSKSVDILRKAEVPFILLHCTSVYPTPWKLVRLGAIDELRESFPGVMIGYSDHCVGNYACFGAAANGAVILEKHFTSDKSWPGPDISISMDPADLKDIVEGSKAISEASGGSKTVLKEEQPTIDFAYACVVALKNIEKGELFSRDNIWVKRPGTGEIKAESFEKVLGASAVDSITAGEQIRWKDLGNKGVSK